MPFVEEIMKRGSVSIVGTAKNTGKTETLNYVLRRLKGCAAQIALTSIGLDGEERDALYQTPKPAIRLYEGMTFTTNEFHYNQRRLEAEVLDYDDTSSTLGRLVTARVTREGEVILAGPGTTQTLKRWIDKMHARGIQTALVDGAFSRMSLASPAVTEAMVLATGVALSASLPELVRRTAYLYELISLKGTTSAMGETFAGIDHGVWALQNGKAKNLGVESLLSLSDFPDLSAYDTFFVAGVLNDKFLCRLKGHTTPTTVIVNDFAKIFVTMETFRAFCREGHRIEVLMPTRLIALTVNPVSPEGYHIDSLQLRQALHKALEIPVFDVFKCDKARNEK